MHREDVEKLPLRAQPVLNAWNSIVSKLHPKLVFVVYYCSDTGEAAIIPVDCKAATTVVNGISFLYNEKRKKVWVYRLKSQLTVDVTTHRRMTHHMILADHGTKHMILCAFSTPERALQCLNRWVETKGKHDLTE